MKATGRDPAATRRDRLLREHVHDPYKTVSKLPEPTFCPDCGAVFHDGRWQWAATRPIDAHEQSCQACHRIRDKYPAGIVTLSGSFVGQHRKELARLARNNEAQEKGAHPLHRIMDIEEHPDSMVITTTDIHLPHRICEALRHAYKGELEMNYDDQGYLLRGNWRRES